MRLSAILAALMALVVLRPAIANERIDRPQLRPGDVFLWHSLEDSTETFLDYVPDPDCPLTPCSRWLGSDWNGAMYFFEDADLNIYKRTSLGGTPIATPYVKRMRFPATDGSTWQSRFRNAAGWDIEQTVTVIGTEKLRMHDGEFNALHLRATNHRLNGSPYLGSAAWFSQDYFVSELSVELQ